MDCRCGEIGRHSRLKICRPKGLVGSSPTIGIMEMVQEKADCTNCGKEVDMDEFVVNWGWCSFCFNQSYELYIESTAGPFDWVNVNYEF